MSEATFDLSGSPQLAANETVHVYRATGLAGPIVDSKTLDSTGATTFVGLEWDTEYVARGSRDVRFRTGPDPGAAAATLGQVLVVLIQDPVTGLPERPEGCVAAYWIAWDEPTDAEDYDTWVPIEEPA